MQITKTKQRNLLQKEENLYIDHLFDRKYNCLKTIAKTITHFMKRENNCFINIR